MSNSDVSTQILMICSTVRIYVLVTGQEQILTELKSSQLTGRFDRRPISRYFDPCCSIFTLAYSMKIKTAASEEPPGSKINKPQTAI